MTKNFDGAVGDNIKTLGAYVMADKQSLNIYSAKDHKNLQSWSIPDECKTSSSIKIVYIVVSEDNNRIGVILGRIIVQDELEITNIVIYVKEGK